MLEGRGRKRSVKVRVVGESVAEYVAPSSVLKTALYIICGHVFITVSISHHFIVSSNLTWFQTLRERVLWV